MVFRKYFIIGILLIGWKSNIIAQGEFLKQGESGWGLASSAVYSKYSYGFGIAAGYSFNGRFDIGLGIGRSYGEPRTFMGDDYQSYGDFLSPKITWLLQKQEINSTFPSLALSFSCQVMSLKTPHERWLSWQTGYQGREVHTTTEFSYTISASVLSDFLFANKKLGQWNFTGEYTMYEGIAQYGVLAGISYGVAISDNQLLILSPVIGLVAVPLKYFLVAGVEIMYISF